MPAHPGTTALLNARSIQQSSISTFGNLNGVKNAGVKPNQTAKGHAFEDLNAGQSKILLNVQGCWYYSAHVVYCAKQIA